MSITTHISQTHLHTHTHSLFSDTPPPLYRHTHCPDRHTHIDTQNPRLRLHFTGFSPFIASPKSPPPLPWPSPLTLSLSLFRAFVCPLPPSFHRLGPDLPLVLDRTIIPRQDSIKYPNMPAILLSGMTCV